MEKDDVAEEEVEDDDAKGEEDDDVENDDVEEEEENDAEDDEVEDDDVEDDDVKGSQRMTWRRMMLRRKRMILRMLMRTDPKTALRVLCDLRSRNALQHFTRATLYANLREKCRGPEPRTTLYASPRSRNACQDFTRATLLGAEMYRKNGAPQNEPRTQTYILCEPARSIHMSKFHKSHFIRKFTGKMPRPTT